MTLILTADTNPGTASWADTSTLGAGFTAVQQRVQLADLPAAAATGTVTFGTVPANTLILGFLYRLNTDIDVGASGITVLDLTAGGGDTGAPADAAQVITSLDMLTETGAPRYVHGYDTGAATQGSFSKGSVAALATPGTGFYSLTATGGNLSDLAAFDVTFILILANLTLVVP